MWRVVESSANVCGIEGCDVTMQLKCVKCSCFTRTVQSTETVASVGLYMLSVILLECMFMSSWPCSMCSDVKSFVFTGLKLIWCVKNAWDMCH